jgi:hypothetical protein
MKFQGSHWKGMIKEKNPKWSLDQLGGPIVVLETLLCVFCLILVFPELLWNAIKLA